MYRLLVFGDRKWNDYEAVKREVASRMPDVVIEGEANGADRMGRRAAEELGIPVVPFPARWDKYGKAAGPIRNQQMIDVGAPTEAIGFHHNISASRGSADMLRRLRLASIPATIYEE